MSGAGMFSILLCGVFCLCWCTNCVCMCNVLFYCGVRGGLRCCVLVLCVVVVIIKYGLFLVSVLWWLLCEFVKIVCGVLCLLSKF